MNEYLRKECKLLRRMKQECLRKIGMVLLMKQTKNMHIPQNYLK